MKKKITKIFSGFMCACLIFSSMNISAMANTSSMEEVFHNKLANFKKEVLSPEELRKSLDEEAKKSDRYIVKYKKSKTGKPLKTKNNVLKSKSVKVKKTDEIIIKNTDNFGNIEDVTLQAIMLEDKVNIDEFISQELKENNEIEFIQADYTFEISELSQKEAEMPASSDIDKSSFGLIDLGEYKAAKNYDDKIIVAVIDTGIDTSHKDLKDKIYINVKESLDNTDSDANGYIDDVNGWNFFDKTNVVYDKEFPIAQAHGTQVAGIISGLTKENYGISKNSNIVILPIKVFSNGIAYTSDIIEAINYAESMGAKIINCSFGSTSFNPALKETMENSSALFVCAAGNGRNNLDGNPVYPAAFGLDNIISVTSVNDDGGLSYFSNYGAKTVDIAAPGRDIISTIPENKYGENTGSSMSAAFVSGTAARILDKNVNLKATEVKRQIIDGADKIVTLDGYVNKAARLNPEFAIVGKTNDEPVYVSAIDDFNIKGLSSDDEQIKLFSSTKNVSVASGAYHNLVLKDDGTVWAWGYNRDGQLGNTSVNESDIPVQVYGLTNIVKISTAGNSNMALKSDGSVWGWGQNNCGELGLGHKQVVVLPMQIQSYYKAKDISMSFTHSLVLPEDGEYVLASGAGDFGQIGVAFGANTVYPLKISVNKGPMSKVYASALNSAIISNSGIYAIGAYKYLEPTIINNSSGLTDIFSGWEYSIAIQEPGKAVILKHENMDIFDSEIFELQGLSNIIKGYTSIMDEVYAIGADGSLWFIDCYDSNKIRKIALENIIDISCGFSHTIALANDGSVWGWGENLYSSLGKEEYSGDNPIKIFNNDLENDGFDSAFEITQTNGVFEVSDNLKSKTDAKYFKITPKESGEYIFDIKPDEYKRNITLFDSEYKQIEMDSDYTKTLKQGKAYFVKVSALGTENITVNFNLTIKLKEAYSEPNTINLEAINNEEYTLAFTGKGISSFANKVYTIKYDPKKLSLIDFAAQTKALDTSIGKIANSNIEIISHANGVITFKVNTIIPNGKLWMGIINMVKFKAIASGTSTIIFE